MTVRREYVEYVRLRDRGIIPRSMTWKQWEALGREARARLRGKSNAAGTANAKSTRG